MLQKQKLMVPSDLLELTKGEYEQCFYSLKGMNLTFNRPKDALGLASTYTLRNKLLDSIPENKKRFCAMGMMFKAMGYDAYTERVSTVYGMYSKYPHLEEQFQRWGEIWNKNNPLLDELGKPRTEVSFGNRIMTMNDSKHLTIPQIQSELRKAQL